MKKLKLLVIISLISNFALAQEEPKEVEEIRKIYNETKNLIPNRDKLSTNYSGNQLIEGMQVPVKTSYTAYFAKNRGFDNQRIIFIEAKFKGGIDGVDSTTEYLFDKGDLIFVYRSANAEGESITSRCYYKGQKVLHRRGEYATSEECNRLRKKGEELKKSILIMQK